MLYPQPHSCQAHGHRREGLHGALHAQRCKLDGMERPLLGWKELAACLGDLLATRLRAQEGGAGEDKAKQLAQQLEKSGLTKELAAQVMADWRKQVGHEVTADDLRKVRGGQRREELA